jgi:curved DNA-binding protein CbpA
MFKKTTISFSCGNLQSLHPASQTSTTSLPRLHSYRTRFQKQQRRRYAMVSDGYSSHNHGSHRWPEVASANAIPTPYQIFGQRKGSPYSKQRFYELVKLYHPDRHDPNHSTDRLSYTTKLERYRLIVAANGILSDPVKRGAYDCYGAGWNGMPEVAQSSEGNCGNGARGWGNNSNGPSQNATWEDWERWYARDSEGPQEPRFTSNGAFVGMIVIFAALGGIGQATRVGNFSTKFIAQRDALHDDISKDLVRRRKETVHSYGSREERIDNFLKQRDPNGYGAGDPRGETYRKLLTAPEVCSSEDIKSRQPDSFKT